MTAGFLTRRTMLDIKTSSTYHRGMAKQTKMKLTDQLRRAIINSGLTRYQIAKETGIDESALSRFYYGERGLSMEALNALGECLELEIVMRRTPDLPPLPAPDAAGNYPAVEYARVSLAR